MWGCLLSISGLRSHLESFFPLVLTRVHRHHPSPEPHVVVFCGPTLTKKRKERKEKGPCAEVTCGLSELAMPGVGVLWEGAMCPLGNPICCLCFLHAGDPLSSLSSHSVCPSVLFCAWFFHSFALCSVCGSVLFWLNLKKNTTHLSGITLNQKTMSAVIPGPRVLLDSHSTQCAQSPVDPRICNKGDLLSERDAHGLLICAFRSLACEVLADVSHEGAPVQLVSLPAPLLLEKQISHSPVI